MSLRGSPNLSLSPHPQITPFRMVLATGWGLKPDFPPCPLSSWLSQPGQAPRSPQQAQCPGESPQGRGEAKGRAYGDKSPSLTCLGLANDVPDLDCTPWDRCDGSIPPARATPRVFAARSHPGPRSGRLLVPAMLQGARSTHSAPHRTSTHGRCLGSHRPRPRRFPPACNDI